MFRTLFRRPRTVRVPVDSVHVDLQTVNVTRQSKSLPRSFPAARFFLMGAATAITIHGLRYLDPFSENPNKDPFTEQLEKAKRTGKISDKDSQYGEQWEKQHAQSRKSSKVIPTGNDTSLDASDTIALTLPIWIRQELPRPYLQNDPAFKEFAKMQGDKKRMNDIRKKILDSVMASFKPRKELEMGDSASPGPGPGPGHPYAFELKVINFTGSVTISLDIIPPLFAPPLLQVPCVWISPKDVNIDFGWRPLPPDTGARVARVFRPLVLFEASFAGAKAFWSIALAITKARINETFYRNDKGSSAGVRPQILIPRVPSTDSSEKSDSTPKQDTPKSKIPFVASLPDLTDGKAMRKMHQDVVSALPYGFAVQGAAKVFKHVRDVKQKQAIPTNMKGACQVKGFLRFHGAYGAFMLHVLAWYIPGEDMFLGGIKIEEAYIIPDYTAIQKHDEDIKKRGREEKARRKEVQNKLRLESEMQAEETRKAASDATSTSSKEEDK